MVVQPRKQNPQHQPLTVSLRKICRDYPAGSGVLKELLQNADDAGASTVVRVTPRFSISPPTLTKSRDSFLTRVIIRTCQCLLMVSPSIKVRLCWPTMMLSSPRRTFNLLRPWVIRKNSKTKLLPENLVLDSAQYASNSRDFILH